MKKSDISRFMNSGNPMNLYSIRDAINGMWRAEIKAHWPRRSMDWRRELIRQYIMLLRLREDNKPERIIPSYRKMREVL